MRPSCYPTHVRSVAMPSTLQQSPVPQFNETIPGRWLGDTSDNANVLLKWLSGSPNFTPTDCFLWGYLKGQVLFPSS